MTIRRWSLAALRARFEGSVQAEVIGFIFGQDHETRVRALQKAMDYACNELERNKNIYQNAGEELITVQICSMLRMAGFQAAHDTAVGGHTDVVVSGDDNFLWLAEAKEHSCYAWLDKGFQQLCTRYSTGVPGQDHGEIIVYCFVENARRVLAKWREQLVLRNAGVKTCDAPCGNPLVFFSKHEHPSSGLDFHVRHKAVALYWSPADR